jgi:pimeloyl-ACP methyl ester carboxylesterase
VDERFVTANGVEFAYLCEGPADGPLALCLHGFPDTAHTWRHLLPSLAQAGFRAVAPWTRGYAPTGVPADGGYETGALAVDACALHDALGGDERAVLVGHDWGAMTSYAAAAYQPERWRRAVAMAVPPFAAIAAGFATYRQLRRSFYIFVFQSPLAEAAVAGDDFAFIEGLWEDWSPGYDGSADVARVKEALADPANLSAAIGYYRAMFDPSIHVDAYAAAQAAAGATPPQPFLYLHGTNDGALGLEVVSDPLAFLAPGSRFEVLDEVGHFLHLEQPKVVGDLVLEFLTEGS